MPGGTELASLDGGDHFAAIRQRLIAVRRQTRTNRRSHPSPSPNKREAVSTELQDDDTFRDRLLRLGIEEITSRDDLPVDPGHRAVFHELPYAQSYIIQAGSSELLHEAQDALINDYHIMPDVPIRLLAPITAGAKVDEAAAITSLGNWPGESGIDDARTQGNRGAGTIVAVLDTGCDADHAEFANRDVEFVWTPLDLSAAPRRVRGFDTVNHGTHVCGIAAGTRSGVAPDATLMVASVIESEAVPTSLQRIMNGLNAVLGFVSRPEQQVKPTILNMSFGFRREWLAPTQLRTVVIGVRLLLQQLVEDFDILPIVAIGNDGPGQVRAPGYFPEVLSVGAVSFDKTAASFSGGGAGPAPFEARTQPALAGYGVDILSAIERDVTGTHLYERKSGTSMATAYVTGIAALTAAKTGLQGAQLRDELVRTAMPLAEGPERVGAGLARYV